MACPRGNSSVTDSTHIGSETNQLESQDLIYNPDPVEESEDSSYGFHLDEIT